MLNAVYRGNLWVSNVNAVDVGLVSVHYTWLSPDDVVSGEVANGRIKCA